MATLKTEHDFDLTRNWYRKSVFLDELWHGMTVATLNSYIRQMTAHTLSVLKEHMAMSLFTQKSSWHGLTTKLPINMSQRWRR